MILHKIKFLTNSPYKPKNIISYRLIRPKFRKYLNLLKLEDFSYNNNDLLRDMKQIAKRFNVLVRFKDAFATRGEADINNRIITVRVKSTRGRLYTKKEVCATFSHEIAHIIQKDVNLISKKKVSSVLCEEQEAESAAYELCKIFFPNMNFARKTFSSYFNENDIIFLAKYYEGWAKNDLFKWQKK
jgi:hypothetical protein